MVELDSDFEDEVAGVVVKVEDSISSIDSITQPKIGLNLAGARIVAIHSAPMDINKIKIAHALLCDGQQGEHGIQLELRNQFLAQAKTENWSAGDQLDIKDARAKQIRANQLPYNQGTRNIQLELSETSIVRVTIRDWRQLTFAKVSDVIEKGMEKLNQIVHVKGRIKSIGVPEEVGGGKIMRKVRFGQGGQQGGSIEVVFWQSYSQVPVTLEWVVDNPIVLLNLQISQFDGKIQLTWKNFSKAILPADPESAEDKSASVSSASAGSA